jgi:ADP-ribosylglycohydrolase
MLGAIAGDIIGSVYEWANIKTTEFPLFNDKGFFTDDSVLTIALADAITNDRNYADVMREYGKKYPNAGYGGYFRQWLGNPELGPYNSFGNGAGMRISPVGWAYDTLHDVLEKAEEYTGVTHNHEEGIKGGCAVAVSIYFARTGESKEFIKKYIEETFDYDLDRTCDDIRPSYKFNETCQGTIPEAIICFLESEDFESAIRLAISLGGDSDTLAAITGSIAEAFYGIPLDIAEKSLTYLDDDMKNTIKEFYSLETVAKNLILSNNVIITDNFEKLFREKQ